MVNIPKDGKSGDSSAKYREEIRQALGGGEEIMDDWKTTAVVVRAKKVLGVTSGQRNQDKEI